MDSIKTAANTPIANNGEGELSTGVRMLKGAGDRSAAHPEERDPVQQVDLQSKEITYALKDLTDKVATYMDKKTVAEIIKAYNFASTAHKGQLRKSGEAYINHPIQVAIILADLHMDRDSIIAALLHDTVEDTSVSLAQVSEKFGPAVSELVDGVTKISQLEIETLSDQQANNIRKMLVAMSKDIRVIVIKLADRLHNMRTLEALPQDRRIFKAHETMEIYAPLANRLGISQIKWELEDLSFYYLDPFRYRQIQRMVQESREVREAYLKRAIYLLEKELDEIKVKAKIQGRPKHLYSIYRKMVSKGKDFSQIYDLIALRVIVGDVAECYSVLGAVHTLWRPMPGRFKDYIAMPKQNFYQSLHTTVIGPAARPLEIQIRTQEMHQMSEYGVAAHWRYKGGKVDDFGKQFQGQLEWLKSILELSDETKDPQVFLRTLKSDLTSDEVFVFTPKGDVISLRNGSSPLDFAYAIHTDVGNHCVGAKVNGAIVPLNSRLEMGDRVEVLTNPNARPSRDWLQYVRTPGARQKIRSFLGKISRESDIERGREELSHELHEHKLGLTSRKTTKALQELAEDLQLGDSDTVFAHIGAGKLTAQFVSNRLAKLLGRDLEHASDRQGGLRLPLLTNVKRRPHGHTPSAALQNKAAVMIEGMDNPPVRLASCCNPIPGDQIAGFITRGKGISVHRSACPNFINLNKREPERVVKADWQAGAGSSGTYTTSAYLTATDRLRLLQDITAALSDLAVNITNINTHSNKDGLVEMQITFEIALPVTVEQVITVLRQIRGVISVSRRRHSQLAA
ncbi:MAG: bifunctional (p)ppGpp synthetase/guanosine-3',5'-bis(diphosphate) 3'-pyrophosphohydrolase [Coriobacteriales bacterium]|jgi:GTP pyrophosphokinase|nr:bifunctional (p)ppGpp synthetase/guanosine-3',5'-bis(diphosphate) 3'-pyrophosphohydrolase [Coriobacteriales bacterium]